MPLPLTGRGPSSTYELLPLPLAYEFVAPSCVDFGWGRRSEIGSLASSLGRRAFFVCGSRTLERLGEPELLIERLRASGVETVRLNSIDREPLVEDVDRAVAQLREHRAGPGDMLVTLGGGSAIDLAKAAAALVPEREARSVRDYLEGVGCGLTLSAAPLCVVALPTTGGTGSEATRNAVISSFDPPFKKSLRHSLLVPRVVLIDPELAVSLPARATACTAMDAITQLIEAFCTKKSSAAVRAMALAGLRLALSAVVEAARDSQSRPAREALAQAAFLSGVALANSGLGMAHGVAAALGVHCRVPHGLACAVMLPAALRANAAVAAKIAEFTSLVPLVTGRDCPADPAQGALDVAAAIDSLLDRLGLPRRLAALGVTREQLPAIVRDSRGNSMSGNPRDISDGELADLLEALL
jgi:alcohol dehydrogenase class IV